MLIVSEEGLVQKRDVPLQVLLRLLKNPLLEVDEIEGMGVFDFFGLQPFYEEGEVV